LFSVVEQFSSHQQSPAITGNHHAALAVGAEIGRAQALMDSALRAEGKAGGLKWLVDCGCGRILGMSSETTCKFLQVPSLGYALRTILPGHWLVSHFKLSPSIQMGPGWLLPSI
jgi:hypothetical protein